MSTAASGFAGGALSGLSVALLMLLNRRIAGISGLAAGPPVFALATGT